MIIPILYEDEHLLIVDKPAGVIVHEGAGHVSGLDGLNQPSPDENTKRDYLLTDWLRKERPDIIESFKNEPTDVYFRPGIVHRLDKDTSGLLVIAKTPQVKQKLQALFKSRQVTKQYATLVLGQPTPEEGSIKTFISRDPHRRRQMAVSFVGKGKEAKTDYKTLRTWIYSYKGQRLPISLIKITLHSGRMHQIRVHMKYKGWPVIGDKTYQTKPSRNISKELGLNRQFLHAEHLAFTHPMSNKLIDIISPLPEDLGNCIDKLEKEEL